ncbi:MAG: LCP family protein [Candidatus Dojkabacteria bacterium]|nr:LCP family protein [Candidatus Dojkabacteria bacterium]
MRITLDESEVKQTVKNTTDIHRSKAKKIKREKKLKRNIRKVEKTNSSGVKKITKIIFSITGTLFAVLLAYGGYMIYKAYKAGTEIGLNLNPSDVISQELPKLATDSSGIYTNILLVGIDTREGGDLLNTDTIILASYNHETHDVTMVSIPRDFHVQVNPDVYWFNRINSVYSTYEAKGEGQGLLRLREVVTEITGIEIQYHAMIDFKGFVELIDTLGGIDVYVENSFTDYRYPAEPGYKTVSFEEGPQHMDGSTALEYARSRHSLQNGEGSDFARARRQQNVISAVTDKIISNSLLNPQSLMNLLNVIQDNVQISEFTLTDVEAGVNELQNFTEDGETYSFVLDPNAGAGKLITSKNVVNTGAYAIGPIDGLGNYTDIQEYIQYVWGDPKLYEEDPVIKTYNTGIGYSAAREEYLALTEQFPYLKISYMGTLYNDKEGIISYLNDEEYQHSLQSINEYLKPDSIEKPDYISNGLNGEDITILFGAEIVQESDTQTAE